MEMDCKWISIHMGARKGNMGTGMKAKCFVGLGLASLLLAGCVVQSIHPLFAEKDIIPFPGLVGTWEQKDDGKQVGLWMFSADGQRYQLTHTDEKGHKAKFDVIAGKIGTNVLLDFTIKSLEPEGSLNDLAAVSLIPAHTFAKVVKKDDALLLVAMDYEWLEKHLTENPKSVTHMFQDKRPILTASTEELQKFVAKYASDEMIFKNEVRLTPK
jgi:hypothetical protein